MWPDSLDATHTLANVETRETRVIGIELKALG
jgi:hypothetical protein